MGVVAIDNDWELTCPSNVDRTVVLVGRTGDGKSSTGNSILGTKAFKSRSSSSGVTSTCELQSTVLNNGQLLNVIDTPGLFDHTAELELMRREIIKCIDGIHAALLVLSTRPRFSQEEEEAIKSLMKFFGNKFSDYMIVIFTGGDDLEAQDETLDDYLGRDDCPEPLQKILEMCGNRCVLFDNRTNDARKKSQQLEQLLSFVDVVVDNNEGKPYTNELFVEMKASVFFFFSSVRS
ncbi:putative protein phloem protein 2-like a3 [Phtheirospermum japonicum]|uniref:AIG1-type G domain-containing protein n=1 Tax=Phtheirospermum japonicum TaxID=374723 RepID=A0A830DG50_9LAMI|nr:putative protein phloem protein 2-like a3 [Phtheirospermum japonicum]